MPTENTENQPVSQDKDILTVADVSNLLDYTPEQVRKLSAAGEIPAKKIGGQWRYLRSSIIAFMEKA